MTTEQEAGLNLAEQALQAKKQSTAQLLALAAHNLNPEIDTESIMAQWLEKWLQENKNRKGANYENNL